MKTLVNRGSELQELMRRQNELNTQVCGENWVEGICSNTGKPINWDMAMEIEWVEFYDSFDWKHWKAQEDDTDNAKMELIDIFHFLLSKYYAIDMQGVDDFIADLPSASEEFNLRYCKDNQTIQYLYEFINKPISLVARWYYACEYLGLTFDDILQVYNIKYALNQVRLMRGYREGTYIKEWGSEEDNIAAVRVIGSIYREDSVIFKVLLDYYDKYIVNEGDNNV